VHCCAAHAPFGIITQSGARAIYLDLSQLRREDEDAFAEAADSGAGIFAGAVEPMNLFHPSVPRPQYADDLGEDGKGSSDSERTIGSQLAQRVIDLWRRLGLTPARCAEQVVIGPACGLAGTSPERAAGVLAACREAGRILPEMIEEGPR
jgi:hypothetical protein